MNFLERTSSPEPHAQQGTTLLMLTAVIAGLVASGCEKKPSTYNPPQIEESAGQETDPRVLMIAGPDLLKTISATQSTIPVTGMFRDDKAHFTLKDDGQLIFRDNRVDVRRGEITPFEITSVESINAIAGTMKFQVKFRQVQYEALLQRTEAGYTIGVKEVK